MMAPISTAPVPTMSAMREPIITWVKKSRPRRSVPAQCSHDGGERRPPVMPVGS